MAGIFLLFLLIGKPAAAGMNEPYRKVALSFSDQLALLRERGLEIEDPERALADLARIGYYRLSGYWLPFKQDDERLDGSFGSAVALYEFDRQLRLLVLDAIERVEVTLRTQIGYVIGHKSGPFGYEDARLFRDDFGDSSGRHSHDRWLQRLGEETERSQEVFVTAYRRKYDRSSHLQIWMATEVMSLGTLSRIYGALLAHEQRQVAQYFGIHFSILHNWLHVFSAARNITAHHGRLWNRDLSIQPKLPRREHDFSDVYIPNQRRSYVLLVMLRHVTQSIDGQEQRWARLVVKHLHQWDHHPHWQQAMGLPAHWHDHVWWEDF